MPASMRVAVARRIREQVQFSSWFVTRAGWSGADGSTPQSDQGTRRGCGHRYFWTKLALDLLRAVTKSRPTA